MAVYASPRPPSQRWSRFTTPPSAAWKAWSSVVTSLRATRTAAMTCALSSVSLTSARRSSRRSAITTLALLWRSRKVRPKAQSKRGSRATRHAVSGPVTKRSRQSAWPKQPQPGVLGALAHTASNSGPKRSPSA